MDITANNPGESEEERPQYTETRDSQTDITGGAHEEDQLEQHRENAAAHPGEQHTQVPLPPVNDGTNADPAGLAKQPDVEYPDKRESD